MWGKTCTGNGNCWLYDAEILRYLLNFVAAFFVGLGTFFDVGVWFLVKDLKIFDVEDDDVEGNKPQPITMKNESATKY